MRKFESHSFAIPPVSIQLLTSKHRQKPHKPGHSIINFDFLWGLSSNNICISKKFNKHHSPKNTQLILLNYRHNIDPIFSEIKTQFESKMRPCKMKKKVFLWDRHWYIYLCIIKMKDGFLIKSLKEPLVVEWSQT